MSASNWADIGYATIALNGTPLAAQRPALNIVTGTGVHATLADNPTSEQTDLTLTASGGGGPGAVTPPQYVTDGEQIAVAGPVQVVVVDTAGGAVTCPLPLASGCSDGQILVVTATNSSWLSYPASLTVETGAFIEDPARLGNYTTAGTLALPMHASAAYTWVLLEGGWKCIGIQDGAGLG